MTVKVKYDAPVDGDVLDLLLATIDTDYESSETISALRAVVVCVGGDVIFAAAYQIREAVHGRELVVVSANGERATGVRWLPKLYDLLLAVCVRQKCARIVVPTTRPAMGKALVALGFNPATAWFAKDVPDGR